MSTVLVTGGTGFVGSHAIVRLLRDGHDVRTTVRTPARVPAARDLVRRSGLDADELRVLVADLGDDQGWPAAVRGCDFVLHVASPFPAGARRYEELVGPARDGTVRVLRAAREGGVRRVVVTSSFGAVGYGHPPREAAFTEEDWTDPSSADVEPYVRSKVVAERAAWDFVEREGEGLELSVVNPVGIFGPVIGPNPSASVAIVGRMLAGQVPACPRVRFGVVDVRDVVDLHVRAMAAPAAAGKRYLACAGASVSMLDVARVLRERLGDDASRVPTRELPNVLVRVMAWFRPDLRPIAKLLGKRREGSSDRAKRELGWAPRASVDALHATGESLLRLGLVPG